MTRIATQGHITDTAEGSSLPIRGPRLPAPLTSVLSPLPLILSDLMVGRYSLHEEIYTTISEYISVVSRRLAPRSLDPQSLEFPSLDSWRRASWAYWPLQKAAGLLTQQAHESPSGCGGGSPLRFVDERGGAHTLFEVLTKVAQTIASVRDGALLLPIDAHVACGFDRRVSAVSVGFGEDRINVFPHAPPIAWSDERDVSLQDASSLKRVFLSVMRLKHFGFTEFLTGGIAMLHDFGGESQLIPSRRLISGKMALTGFELLTHVARAVGDTRSCTNLLSPVLAQTWTALCQEAGVSPWERPSVVLPFEYSQDTYAVVRLGEALKSVSSRGLQEAGTGLKQLVRLEPALAVADKQISVQDFLGRELWPSLEDALRNIAQREGKAGVRSPRVSAAEVGHPIPLKSKLACNVRKLVESAGQIDPREHLLERCDSRANRASGQMLCLSEADYLLKGASFDAATMVDEGHRNIGLIQHLCMNPLDELTDTLMKMVSARGSLIPFDEREELHIATSDGTVLFRSLDDFFHYRRRADEWIKRQILCVMEVLKYDKVTCDELRLIQKHLDGSLSAAGVPKTTALIAPYELRAELPRELERDAAALCSRYPALWPLYFPRRTTHGDALLLSPRSDLLPLFYLLSLSPNQVLDGWLMSHPEASEYTQGEAQRAIKAYVAVHLDIAREILYGCGFDDVRNHILEMGEEWGTAPRALVGKHFVDDCGRVVAENVGHFVSIHLALARVCIDAGLTIAAHQGVRIDEESLENQAGVYGYFAEALRPTKGKEPATWDASIGVRATLETLSHPKLQKALCEGEMSVLDAYKVLDEVAQQMFGAPAYSRIYDPWITDQVFSSKQMRFQCLGSELIRYARGDKPEASEPAPAAFSHRREIEGALSKGTVRVVAKEAPLESCSIAYDLTQGRELRPELVAVVEAFGKSMCRSYPSLSALFYPRKRQAEEVAIVAHINWGGFIQGLRAAPERAEAQWSAEKGRRTKKRWANYEAKSAFIEDYSVFQRKSLSILDDLMDGGIDRGGISPENWSTTPANLNGVVFVDQSGFVIAENFGHLLTMAHDLHRFCMDREEIVAKRLRAGLDPDDSILALADEGFHAILQIHVRYVEPPKPFILRSGEYPAVTLAGLGDRRIKQGIRHNELRSSEALALLNEAAAQLYGAPHWSSAFDELCTDLAFCDPSRTYGVLGKDLLRALTRATKVYTAADTASTSPKEKLSKREIKATRAQRRSSLYLEMFRNREVPLGTLFLASCALGDAAESVSGYRAFKGALLPSVESSQSAERASVNSRKDQTLPSSPVEVFSELIEASGATVKKVDLSVLGRMRLANLLYQLCYRSFSGDVSRVIAELEKVRNDAEQGLQHERQLATDILRDVVPLLLQQLRREKDFEVPGSILFEPFGYQRAWVSAAQSGECPLLVGAPGSGKTEMGVLLAAAYLEGNNEELAKRVEDEAPRKRPPRRVLWITAPSNITGTSSRIAKRISTPILQLTPELLKRSADSLRVLLQEFSLISFTYSSNAAVWARRPEHFAVLKEWLHGGLQEGGHPSGLLIADEGQFVDNARSLRSQAVRALGAEKVAVLSGTPVQHRRENIATLLHTTLPGHYPNVDALRRALKHDKTLALAMFHQHATIIGIDEIARTFKPFSEIPAEEQVSQGLPCVPKVHERYKDFSLSADHTRRYINIAVGEAGDDPSHVRSAHLRRFAKLRRLLASPTKLGAEPGYAMLQAVKEVAIPAMRRGEKVIILGEHLDPLEFIARDPEMQRFGAALVTGSSASEERSATVQRLSRDPSLMCAIGQIRVLGTGHDCLGVEHVIFIEPPRVVSDLLQGMSRHRRLVTKETLSLARSDVYVWYLRAQLDEDVVGLVPSQAHRDVLRQGSVYERAMDRMVAQAREYSELTSHPTKIKLAEDTTVSAVITVLSKDLEVLSKKREEFHELSDARLEELFIRYRSSEKEA